MTPGTQELLAVLIVVAVVAFALWRRSRKPRNAGCHDCDAGSAAKSEERTVRFHRRED